VDVSALSVAAIHRAHLPAGASSDVRAVVRVSASGLGDAGVDASLRLWTPRGARVLALRERLPATRDLHDRASRLDDLTAVYAAGRWTDGAREYELAIALPPGRAGDEMLAARVGVVLGDAIAGVAPIAVTWTGDEAAAAVAGGPRGPLRPADDAVADLPTGPSPKPRHLLAAEPLAVARCPACDLCAGEDDRFCERCGCELAGAQKS
jgi:hypothetical protein